MKKPQVYYLQNQAIHQARAQLEEKGVLDPWSGLDQVREIAGELNAGLQSISALSLLHREQLIDRLIRMGAQVRNPHVYESDLAAEANGAPAKKKTRKVVVFSLVSEEELRMLDTLAARVRWHTPDGYKHFCLKLLRSPRPRNSKEVTKLRLALTSLIGQAAS